MKSWQVPDSEFTKTQKVTLRRILIIAAVSVPGFLGYAADAPLPTLTQILDGTPPANSQPVRVDMVPGTKFRYAGGGYAVLQQLLTDVSGKSFPDLLDQLVLEKLNMDHSTFLSSPPEQLASDMAAGHLPDGQVIEGGHFRYPELAPAGLWSTPTDLVKLVLEIQNSLHGKSGKVLAPEMTRQMLTPQIENSGLGFFVDGADRARRFTHTGSNVGSSLTSSAISTPARAPW